MARGVRGPLRTADVHGVVVLRGPDRGARELDGRLGAGLVALDAVGPGMRPGAGGGAVVRGGDLGVEAEFGRLGSEGGAGEEGEEGDVVKELDHDGAVWGFFIGV